MASDKKKYNCLEDVIQKINASISLNNEDVRRNDRLLANLLPRIIERMKSIDPLFKKMYDKIYYGGGYYDGLKINEPEEYDLDVLLRIPKYAGPFLHNFDSDFPGFVNVKLENFDNFLKQPEAHQYVNFEKFLLDDERFLTTGKILAWMESMLIKAAMHELSSYKFETIPINYKITKSGPALTLKLSSNTGIKIDIDFVASFVFTSDKWPKGFRSNPTKKEFFIVPKSPKDASSNTSPNKLNRYWRLSFQEQEKELIGRKNFLKPTIRLLKKLKETSKWPIASYYMKTVVLWMNDNKEASFWNNSLSCVFMEALELFKESIDNKRIDYYWCHENNLLGRTKADTFANMSGRLKAMISNVDRHLTDDPKVIARYLLNREEYELIFNTPTTEQQQESVSKDWSCVIS